jgi:phosphotransferase system enzyme I (PtsI)
LEGIAVADGLAEGAASLMPRALVIRQRQISRDEIRPELVRLEEAIDQAEAGLDALAVSLPSRDTEDATGLVAAYRFMLRSPEIAGGARRRIAESAHAAEWAVRQATDETVGVFDAMTDGYFRERGRDAHAVGDQLLRALMGLPGQPIDPATIAGRIAVDLEFSPLDVVRLHAGGVLGFVAETGGRSSHAAILARSFGLPFVSGVVNAYGEIASGAAIALDADHGRVFVDPTAELLEALRASKRRSALPRRPRPDTAGPATTRDGTAISLNANIEALGQVSDALALGAGGIGLFRTEFLYLDRADLPSEDEQYHDARSVLAALGGKMATFRTLDLGGEKLPLAVKVPEGHNPALGVRSIRFSLRRPDILRTQLRALYRAAVHGPLRIMFPLVADVGDLRRVLRLVDAVKAELASSGIRHNPDVPLGAMIETPSAAVTAEHLGRHCDFLSLGTNDLIQYAFAADRDNPDVDDLYHPLHPAVLRLVKLAIDGAAAAGKPISICGDLAGDAACTLMLVGLGLRELSMRGGAIPNVEAAVRGCRLADAQALVAEALALESGADVEALAARSIPT